MITFDFMISLYKQAYKKYEDKAKKVEEEKTKKLLEEQMNDGKHFWYPATW